VLILTYCTSAKYFARWKSRKELPSVRMRQMFSEHVVFAVPCCLARQKSQPAISSFFPSLKLSVFDYTKGLQGKSLSFQRGVLGSVLEANLCGICGVQSGKWDMFFPPQNFLVPLSVSYRQYSTIFPLSVATSV
jgi:hypothetical protein